MINKKSGIYIIINLITLKFYIGSAVNFKNRKNVHLHHLRMRKHHSPYLQKSFNKHGEINFKFEILEIVENKTKLIEREQYYIDTLNPQYNICKKAGSLSGLKHSKESILRGIQTKIKNGNDKPSKETIQKRVQSNKGKKRTLEQRENISKGKKKYVFTEEHKKNISLNSATKGKPGTMLGKKMPCDPWNKGLKNDPKSIESSKKAWDTMRANGYKSSQEDIQNRIKGIKKAFTERREEILANKRIGYNNQVILKCPHCNYTSKNAGSIKAAHFDNCQKHPNFDMEAFLEKKRLMSIKLKEAKKNQPLIECPHCKKSSRNRGTMTRVHFDNCRIIKDKFFVGQNIIF